MDDNIKNAFNCVAKMFDETSFLLRDFKDIMEKKHDFTSTQKGKNANAICTNTSKSLNSAKEWLPRYIADIYERKQQAQNKGANSLLLITVSFYNGELNAVGPYLVLGVVKGSTTPWQLHSPFFNDSDSYEYSDFETEEKLTLPHSMDKNIKFRWLNSTKRKQGYPVEGIFFYEKLLSIKDYKDIELRAKRIVDLWHKYNC